MSNLITVKNCTSQEEALSFLNKIDHSYDLELISLIFKESFLINMKFFIKTIHQPLHMKTD